MPVYYRHCSHIIQTLDKTKTKYMQFTVSIIYLNLYSMISYSLVIYIYSENVKGMFAKYRYIDGSPTLRISKGPSHLQELRKNCPYDSFTF